MAAPIMAQSSVLDALRETVVSRWDFQEHFPVSAKLFANPISDSERIDLIHQLQVAQPKPEAVPGAPTFADLWANFALGLAFEKTKVGEGENNLLAAAGMAKGNIAVNYELARILTQVGMYQRARAFQMEMQRSMLEKGYVRVPELAKVELLRAREAMSLDWYQVARQEADFAARLDPLCPWVPFLLMEMELREKSPLNWDLGSAGLRLIEAVRLLRYYDSQSFFLINLSRILRAGLGIFGGIALLVLFGRYFTRIAHLFAEKLPKQVELRVRYLALALLPLSLVIGGLGYAAVGLILTMLLWRHVTEQEKSFLKLVMACLALMPFFLMWEQSMGRHLYDTNGINLYHQAYARGYEAPLLARLDSFKSRTQEDALYRSLAYSITHRKQGDYVKSKQYADAASKREPASPFVLINQGNLAMVNYDYTAASTAYSQARKAAPEMVETWFNSSQAALYANSSMEHKKFLDHAAERDPQLINQFLRENDENFQQCPPTRKFMEPMLRISQSWTAAWNSLLDFDFLGVTVKMGVYTIPGGLVIAAVVLVALLLYFRFRQYSQYTHGKDLFNCKICGRVMCRVCRKGVHCQTCFKTVSGIHDTRVKMEMAHLIRTRATLLAVRIGAILNSALPGAGYLYLGVGSGRFGWVLASSMLIGGLWQINHLLMEYPAFVLGPLRWLPWFPIALLYGLFNLKLLRASVDMGELIPSSTSKGKEAAR